MTRTTLGLTAYFSETGKIFRAFSGCRRGTVAIEYALIAFLVSVAIFGTLAAIGDSLRDDYFGPVVSAFTGS